MKVVGTGRPILFEKKKKKKRDVAEEVHPFHRFGERTLYQKSRHTKIKSELDQTYAIRSAEYVH